jgi:CheY-like chemotaxis protein
VTGAAEHLARVGRLLRSLQTFRGQALAQGDAAKAARAEELIVRLEQRVARLEAAAGAAPAAAPAPARLTAAGEAAQMGRRHVLVVNRAPEFLHVVGALLQDERYNVTTTTHVPRTFDLIAALAPDLLLVDLTVGERAGWALLERLHAAAATRGIPVIVTAADPALLARAHAGGARYGGARVLPAPLDLDALLAVVAQLIGTA